MATLIQALRKADLINREGLIQFIFNFIKSIESELADLNRKQLFENSEDIFGDAIGFYSKATERITTEEFDRGERSDIKEWGQPYNMKDQNNFLPSIYASVSKDFVTFGATDPKLDEILSNERLLSKDLFGLTPKNRALLILGKILPALQAHNKKLLHS